MTPTTTILITGSSGLIGTALTPALEQRSLALRRFDLREEVGGAEEKLRQDSAINFVTQRYNLLLSKWSRKCCCHDLGDVNDKFRGTYIRQ
jgi:nucleoside-diphosphate-sugar epimerase